MVRDDRAEFGKAMVVTAELYDKHISSGRIAAYFKVMEPYPLDGVLEAMQEHQAKSRWFPLPADLIELMAPTGEQDALFEWSHVIDQLRDSRRARTDNPCTHRAIQDLGGFIRLGQMPQDQLVWVQKEFVQRYQMYKQYGIELQPKQLFSDRLPSRVNELLPKQNCSGEALEE